jgi:BirA family biotin operon repressor/biotin-[acetyl-CoA-carboxylase] ligase
MDSFVHFLQEITRRRPAAGGPENVVVLEQTESTNRLARGIVSEYEKEGQSPRSLLVLAFEQSGGRGRQGRSWASPAGKGVYATRVLAVDDPADLSTLPLLVGVGLCQALSRHLAARCRLKWPNDLLVESAEGRRKIGGVLIEASAQPGEGAAALIGFGVNHGQEADELPAGATSLRLEGEADLALEELTWELVAGVERELVHLGDDAYAVDVYRRLSIHRPGEPISCRVGDKVVEGTFSGIDERGRLQLESAGREVALSAGEVIER